MQRAKSILSAFLKFIVSCVLLLIFVLHVSSIIHVDVPALVLLILIAFLWSAEYLQKMFKIIEIPGGWKFELKTPIEKIKAKAVSSGLIDAADLDRFTVPGMGGGPGPLPSFVTIADNDPQLALAGLRLQIEDELRKIAFDLTHNPIEDNGQIGLVIFILKQRGLFKDEQESILYENLSILNQADHCHSL